MTRYYTYNGKKLPSVTTFCSQLDKPALTYWAANCACDYILNEIKSMPRAVPGGEVDWIRRTELYPTIESARKNFRSVSAQALDIGSAVHQAIEHYLKTGQEPQSPSEQVLSAFLAFLEWEEAHELVTIKTEWTVYADRFAGTCDLYCVLDGKHTLVDFKASKGIYDEMRYQVAAYRSCLEGCEACGILRLDKETGLPEWKDTSDTYEQDLRVFNALVELWYARKGE